MTYKDTIHINELDEEELLKALSIVNEALSDRIVQTLDPDRLDHYITLLEGAIKSKMKGELL